MPFYIHVAHPFTKKYLVVRLAHDSHTEIYQVIGNGFIVTLQSNRPFIRSKFGKDFTPVWRTIEDSYDDRILENKIVFAIMDIIDAD